MFMLIKFCRLMIMFANLHVLEQKDDSVLFHDLFLRLVEAFNLLMLHLSFWSTRPTRNLPVVIIAFTHVVRPSVPTFHKRKAFSSENNIRYWWACIKSSWKIILFLLHDSFVFVNKMHLSEDRDSNCKMSQSFWVWKVIYARCTRLWTDTTFVFADIIWTLISCGFWQWQLNFWQLKQAVSLYERELVGH